MNETMTPKDAVTRLRDMMAEQDGGYDEEGQHVEGDNILLAVLRHLGHPEVADAWNAASEGWWWA